MAKTPIPLLSLGATGTIAHSITYKRSRLANIVQKKPILPYFLTLPTQYQRWLYWDFAHQWHQQSTATKQTYQSSGSRHHLTGFQYWMKYHLTNLTYIAGWWKFDDTPSATTPDSSRHGQTATIFGATPSSGYIDRALLFDGINDYVEPAATSHLDITAQITLEALVYPTGGAGNNRMILGIGTGDYCFLRLINTNKFQALIQDSLGGYHVAESDIAITLNQLYHVAGRYDGAQLSLFVDGIKQVGVSNFADTIKTSGTPKCVIGRNTWGGDFLPAIIDNPIVWNIPLTDEALLRHSGRRYPL